MIFSRSARFDRDEMVFGDLNGGGGGLDNRDNNQRDEAARIQALRTANCIKILGKGVIRVVHRVDDARESNALGMPYPINIILCYLAGNYSIDKMFDHWILK